MMLELLSLVLSPAAKVGDPANLTLSPSTDYVKIMNETKTVEKNGSTKIKVERKHGTNQVIIKGTIALDHKNLKSWITNSGTYPIRITCF